MNAEPSISTCVTEILLCSRSTLSSMPIGNSLTLQIVGTSKRRLPVNYVGYFDGRYLVFAINASLGVTHCNQLLPDGTCLVVRGIMEGVGGACIAFKTKVIMTLSQPFAMVFTEFPQEIQKHELRKHPRVSTCIDARLMDFPGLDASGYAGYLADVSLGGCCFSFELPEFAKGVKEQKVAIQVGSDTASSPIEVTGVLKNQRKDKKRLMVGMQFTMARDVLDSIFTRLYLSQTQLQSG